MQKTELESQELDLRDKTVELEKAVKLEKAMQEIGVRENKIDKMAMELEQERKTPQDQEMEQYNNAVELE